MDAVASTPAGIFYAVQTLRQIAATAGAQWPLLRIDDAPALANRGVMLDISRNRVPTMQTLYTLVDLFAALVQPASALHRAYIRLSQPPRRVGPGFPHDRR